MMRHTYLYFWVFSICLLQFNVYGLPDVLSQSKEEDGEAISMIQYHKPNTVQSSCISWQGSMKRLLSIGRTYNRRYSKAKAFWENYGDEHCATERHQSMIKSMKRLLLSKTDSWQHQVNDLFKKARGSAGRQIIIFYFLRKLLDFYEVPCNTILEILDEIAFASSYSMKWEWDISQAWKQDADLTMKLYDARSKGKEQLFEQTKIPRVLENTLVGETRVFWEKYKEYFHEKMLKPGLIKSLNNVLLSHQDNWTLQVQYLSHREWKSDFDTIVILRFLRTLVDFDSVTFETLQSLRLKIDSMAYPAVAGRWLSQDRKQEFELTTNLYDQQLENRIFLLKPGVEIAEFLAKQRKLGRNGLRLQGNWPSVYQKIILMFWVNYKEGYFEIKQRPKLHYALEAEIVQKHLIETVQKFQHTSGELHHVYVNWAYSTIKSQSDIIVSYTKSIKNELDEYEFISPQFKLWPYGIRFNRARRPTEHIKIIQFWSSNVLVFLKMDNLGETPSLQNAVEFLVIEDFKETSEIMEKFLIIVDGQEFTKDVPVLAQFLHYFLGKTKTKSRSEYSVRALCEFYQDSHKSQHVKNFQHTC